MGKSDRLLSSQHKSTVKHIKKKKKNFVIDRKGKKIKKADILRKPSEILGEDRLEQKEKEITYDLFGDIEENDHSPVTQDKKENKAVWHDEDDEIETNILRITRDNAYARMYSTVPEWAKLDRKVDEDEHSMHVGKNLIENDARSKTIKFRPLNDLNGDSHSEGALVKVVEFHQRHQVALVCGSKKETLGSASIFKVDGERNPRIEGPFHFPNFPVKCAKFLPDGKRIIFGSNTKGHLYTYDMEIGKRSYIPWNKSEERKSMKYFEVSAHSKVIVFVGHGGKLHIFDSENLSHIHTMQVPCEVKSIAFNNDGTQLFTHGDNGQVYVFDMNTRDCVHAFYDHGCVEGSAVAVSSNNRLLACGSTSGIVNLYETSSLNKKDPMPVKIVTNLVTRITGLEFNPDSEILAMYSDNKANAMKLLNLSTFRVYENFPPMHHDIKRIQTAHFSPQGGYLAAGNNYGKALLYRIKKYSSY